MKKILSMLAIVSLVTSFIGCDEDETFDAPTIEIVNTDLEQRAGEVIEIDASVVADAGVKSITVSIDGGAEEDVTGDLAGAKAGLLTYEYTVPADDAEGETHSVVFNVTDKKNKTAATPTPATITVA